MYHRLATAACALALALTVCSAARADDRNIPTAIQGQNNFPVALMHCSVVDSYGLRTVASVVNRTSHQLISYSIRVQFWDMDGALMGQTTTEFRPDDLVAPGDTVSTNSFFTPTNSNEPNNAVGRAACRIMSAKFTGQHTWNYPQRWSEPVTRIPQDSGDTGGGSDRSPQPTRNLHATFVHASSGRVGVQVTNAWNDNVNGMLMVHDTLTLTGGASESTVNPSDLTLTMNLTNGARKNYSALSTAAPSYSKFSALTNSSTLAYEVDPNSDLGRIGSITVPAHGVVTVTATFPVTDAVANPNDNRLVALR